MKIAQLDYQGINGPVGGFGIGAGRMAGSLSGTQDIISIFINILLPYIFVLSGIILIFFVIISGINLMLAAGDPKKSEEGKARLTSAIIGFTIIFATYWIYEIVRYILGLI